jgi:hypothetical protein
MVHTQSDGFLYGVTSYKKQSSSLFRLALFTGGKKWKNPELNCEWSDGDSNFRVRGHPARKQRESNRSRRNGEMFATIAKPFGSST